MRGYPKHLNSKADYEYVRTHFDKSEWEKDFKALITSQYIWPRTSQLEKPEDGITDETHQVVTIEDDISGVGKIVSYWQAERQVNPDCKMLRLGYTEDEVKAILAA